MTNKVKLEKPRNAGAMLSLAKLGKTGVSDELLTQINSLPQVLTPLSTEQLIVRGMYLMNDQPMHETPWFIRKFDAAAVQQAVPLVRGKPVICNHTTHGRDGLPIGRMFAGTLEQREDGSTWLAALFYMLNDTEGQQFAAQIDGGLIAENSPTVEYDRLYCSICGADELDCEHMPGKLYDGKICYAVMSTIKDIYEASLAWAGMQRGTGFYVAAGREFVDMDEHLKAIAAKKQTRAEALSDPWRFMKQSA